ncbi:polysaccharide pyruvyl transferase family protein [Glaciecola siphonariae]|uniref:Polysaccharide pyruvyl transferase family protein n=1 Tax=Glaciecola siphonariae TaxID=521012 RepID=A0ABV9LXU4_9ALTE
MSNERYFFVRIITSFNNEGDLLINRALLQFVSSYGKVIIDRRSSPDEFLEELTKDIENCELSDTFYKTLIKNTLSRHKTFLLTIPGHFFGEGIKKAFSIFVSACFFYLLKIGGVKILKFGGCLGPFDWPVKVAERFRASAFTFYGIRDSISIANLNKSSKVERFPDLAFVSDDIKKISENKQSERNGNLVISFREQTNAMFNAQGYTEKITDKLAKLIEQKQANKLVFCYQVPSDRDFNHRLFCEFKERGYNCEFINKKLRLNEALKLYANSSFVLSNRLHILVPSLCFGTAHLGIIDKKQHHKILGIYRDLNIDSLLVDIDDEITPETIANTAEISSSAHLSSLYNQELEYAHKIRSNIMSL